MNFIVRGGFFIEGKWNLTREGINKFFKLKNGQWLKIIFSYKSKVNIWFVTICVADSKRQCNDCMRKTEHSPKVLYGRSTGNKTGFEPLAIALKSLLEFENCIKNAEIRIVGASERLTKIYARLLKYGYKSRKITYNNNKEREVYYKMI